MPSSRLFTSFIFLPLLCASVAQANSQSPPATAPAANTTAQSAANKSATVTLVMEVLLGKKTEKIEIELDAEKAPGSTENFLKYVDAKFYDGTVFHRIISNFMIQGGGMTADGKEKNTLYPAIQNEAHNGLKNARGTIAMARTNEPHSATSQFFINVVDNDGLNHVNKNNGRSWGYAVFGKVTKGLEIVDKIRNIEVKTNPYGEPSAPTETVLIKTVRRK